MKKIIVLIITAFIITLLVLFILFNTIFKSNNISSPVSENGKLEVINADIVNENGEKFSLKGLSSSRTSMDL